MENILTSHLGINY